MRFRTPTHSDRLWARVSIHAGRTGYRQLGRGGFQPFAGWVAAQTVRGLEAFRPSRGRVWSRPCPCCASPSQ